MMDDETRENRTGNRRGPLGDEGDTGETRRVRRAGDEASTGRIPPEDTDEQTAPARAAPEKTEEDPETRVIRTPGGAREDEAMPYPRGYMEADEMREARLKEIYGGVDWLASFIGCIFALLCGGVLISIAGLIVGFFLGGLTLDLQTFGAGAVTSLVVVGLALFLAFFCGGYVAGRLVRFDGGRNGAMTVGWGLLLIVIFLIFGAFLGGPIFEPLRNFVQSGIGPAFNNLSQAGLVGIGVAVGAILLEVLGGFLGGRLGQGYHIRIDETS